MKIQIIFLLVFMLNQPIFSQDWPQHQHDAARTGRTSDEIPPPYRARWIWLGEGLTLRNQNSEPGWTDNLTSVNGYSFPLPDSVPYTISQLVQPIISNGKVFFGTQEGGAFAISAFDGTTLWKSEISGGILVTAAVKDDVVIFAGVAGIVKAFDVDNGATLWLQNLKYAITTAPCIVGESVFVADHRGRASAFDIQTGSLRWQKNLSAPVTGGIAASGSSVFFPCEDMMVYALDLQTGVIKASGQVRGQSFRLTHPVVFKDFLYVTSGMTPLMGSEYMMEELMATSASPEIEENNIRLWLQGNNNGGAWPLASVDWQHVFAMDTATLEMPFIIAAGPSEGCGFPPEPVVVDYTDRVLCWWKTRFPKLTANSAFGTSFSLDICGINPANGNRINIDNGHLSNIFQETDNLFAMSSGGKYLWLRQDFRGTQVINLENSTSNHVVAPIRNQDGGFWAAQICYLDQSPPYNYKTGPIVTGQQSVAGRTAPAIAGNTVFIAETFGIIAIENDNQ